MKSTVDSSGRNVGSISFPRFSLIDTTAFNTQAAASLSSNKECLPDYHITQKLPTSKAKGRVVPTVSQDQNTEDMAAQTQGQNTKDMTAQSSSEGQVAEGAPSTMKFGGGSINMKTLSWNSRYEVEVDGSIHETDVALEQISEIAPGRFVHPDDVGRFSSFLADYLIIC